ncbi:MAG: hypothetical protein FWC66_01490 [Oscillospiraceae bacterium]|nr:hypothetical protein [Oscillospiraceae bacterium]
MDNKNTNKSDKWDFDDYAFTITGILVGVLLVVPEILYTSFGISILGGGFSNAASEIFEGLDDGFGVNFRNIYELRSLSPLLFLLTTTICFFKDAIDARKSGGYKGSVFTHTFESLFEDAIYMAITTIMVYGAVLFGAMYASWLAGPIAWILFVFIFPLVRKDNNSAEAVKMPWLLLLIFLSGIIVEAITREWIAFPLSWLIICVFKLVGIFRAKIFSTDAVFDILYYTFSIALLAVGMILNSWLVSWVAFPVALFICWIMSKFKRVKNTETTRQ